MKVNKLAGLCLIMFGIINVLHEIAQRASDSYQPGIVHALVTAFFFAMGTALFLRSKTQDGERGH